MQHIKKVVFLFTSFFTYTITALSFGSTLQSEQVALYGYSAHELFSIGSVLMQRGAYNEARTYLEQAVAKSPENAPYNWTFGDAYLFLEMIQTGMHHFSFRWIYDAQFDKKKIWNGQDLEKKIVVVQHQWDLRNTLLCLRYLRLLKEAGATVILRIPEIHKPLLKLCPFVDIILPTDQPLPSYDFIIPIMHLPTVYETTINSIPSEHELLIPLSASVEFNSLIGITLSSDTIASKLDASKINNNNNQITRITMPEQKTMVWNATHIPLTMTKDYEEFVNICSQLKFFVTDDTIAAQIAGLLNIPTLLLLGYNHDWFWHINRTDSPWFKSVNLVRTTENSPELTTALVAQSIETVCRIFS